MRIFKWFDVYVFAKVDRYVNNQICIRLEAVDCMENARMGYGQGELLTTATVCNNDVVLENNQALIKDYNAGLGIFDVLKVNGVVRDTGQRVYNGDDQIPIADVLIQEKTPL